MVPEREAVVGNEASSRINRHDLAHWVGRQNWRIPKGLHALSAHKSCSDASYEIEVGVGWRIEVRIGVYAVTKLKRTGIAMISPDRRIAHNEEYAVARRSIFQNSQARNPPSDRFSQPRAMGTRKPALAPRVQRA
jgi:hypothetical protein